MTNSKRETSIGFFLFQNKSYLKATALILILIFYLAINKIQNNKFYFRPRANERRVAILGDSLSVQGTYDVFLRNTYNILSIETFASAGGQTGWYEGSEGNARGLNYQFDTLLLKSGKQYDDIIVFGGVNDLDVNNSLETTENNLQSLYDKINASGMRVIAISVLPWRGCHCSNIESKTSAVQTLNNWMQTKAKHITTSVYAYDYFFDSKDSAVLKQEYYKDDGLHLSRKGYEKLAELIYESVYK